MKRPILWCRKVCNVHHCEILPSVQNRPSPSRSGGRKLQIRFLPKAIFLKIMVAFFVFVFIGGYVSLNVLAETEGRNPSSGMILYVDQGKGFVIIDLGKEDGLEEDCFFEVYRRDIKIGEIKTVKVRKRFSAADIEATYKNRFIKVGDQLRASKKTAAVLSRKEMESFRKELDELSKQAQEYLIESKYELAGEKINEILELDPENEKALEMLSELREAFVREEIDSILSQAQGYFDEMEYELAGEKINEILELDPEEKEALNILRQIEESLRATAGLEPETITIDINAPKHIILTSVIDVFRKYGYMITFSDPARLNLKASKDVKPSLAREIIAEWGPYARNKVYYTVEINELPKSEYLIINRLVIYLRKGYHRQGRFHYCEIKKTSSTYKEARNMAFAIKKVAEEL